MSYICLMVNDEGAVAAADSRESFANLAHFDWLRKAYAVPERDLVFCCCGPSFRFGVPIFKRAAAELRRSRGTIEEQLRRIGTLADRLTAVRFPGERPGVFVILAARWEDNGFTVYNFWTEDGRQQLQRRRVRKGQPVSLHAGAWHHEMPPLPPCELAGLSFDALRERARERVALAIRKDEERKAKNRRHNQTIGGPVHTCGIRVKR